MLNKKQPESLYISNSGCIVIPGSILDIGHQRDMTGSLDRNRQRSLVLCAVSCDSSRKDLPALGDKSLELVGILVVNDIILSAEHTNLFSSVHGASPCRSVACVFSIIRHLFVSSLTGASLMRRSVLIKR